MNITEFLKDVEAAEKGYRCWEPVQEGVQNMTLGKEEDVVLEVVRLGASNRFSWRLTHQGQEVVDGQIEESRYAAKAAAIAYARAWAQDLTTVN